MARFFKNTNGQHVDFVVSPDIDLRKELANSRIKAAQTLALFDEVPEVNFIYNPDFDTEFAQETKEKYNTQLETLYQGIRENPENYRDFLPQIRQVSNDLRQNFTSGDIYRMQTNYQKWMQDQEDIQSLTNPVDIDRYSQQATRWGEEGGSRNGLYKPLTKYETQDIFKRFWDDWGSQMKADGYSREWDEIGGRWITRKGMNTQELSQEKIEEAFQAYVASNPEIGGRAAQERDVFGNTSWHDEEGNLSFSEDSYLGNIMRRGARSMAFKNITESSSSTSNPYGEIQARTAADAESYRKRLEIDQEFLRGVASNPDYSAFGVRALGAAMKNPDLIATGTEVVDEQYRLLVSQNLIPQETLSRISQSNPDDSRAEMKLAIDEFKNIAQTNIDADNNAENYSRALDILNTIESGVVAKAEAKWDTAIPPNLSPEAKVEAMGTFQANAYNQAPQFAGYINYGFDTGGEPILEDNDTPVKLPELVGRKFPAKAGKEGTIMDYALDQESIIAAGPRAFTGKVDLVVYTGNPNATPKDMQEKFNAFKQQSSGAPEFSHGSDFEVKTIYMEYYNLPANLINFQ